MITTTMPTPPNRDYTKSIMYLFPFPLLNYYYSLIILTVVTVLVGGCSVPYMTTDSGTRIPLEDFGNTIPPFASSATIDSDSIYIGKWPTRDLSTLHYVFRFWNSGQVQRKLFLQNQTVDHSILSFSNPKSFRGLPGIYSIVGDTIYIELYVKGVSRGHYFKPYKGNIVEDGFILTHYKNGNSLWWFELKRDKNLDLSLYEFKRIPSGDLRGTPFWGWEHTFSR